MSFDLARTLRRLKPAKLETPLVRRHPDELPFIGAALRPGPELLLDTTVYIDGLKDQSPEAVDALLAMRVCNHSAVCVAELTHAFGRLDPRHAATPGVLAQITKTIHAMPAHRLREPSGSAWGSAGILAGLLFRLGCYQRGQERKLLNDTLVYLQALEHGQVVLTANVADFDFLNQLLPEGRFLVYHRS